MQEKEKASNDFKLAYSIREFCSAIGVSRNYVSKLRKEGKGPLIITVGTKRLIKRESAIAWLNEFEERKF